MLTQRGIINLYGDGILDNFNSLDDKSKDLKHELELLKYKVNNYAVDGLGLYSFRDGIYPKCAATRPYKYNLSENGKCYPLNQKPLCNVYSSSMSVISFGGEDIRAKFMRAFFGVESLMDAILTKDYVDTAENVVAQIKQNHDKVLLVMIYCPYMGPGSLYSFVKNSAEIGVKRWFTFMDNIAKKYNVAMLDLSRTFDRFNADHYDSSGTCPSNLSNKCLAECISHIYKNYSGYKVYSAPGCDISKIIHD